MSESLLRALMQLLAFVVIVDNDGSESLTTEVFESYLEHDIGEEQTKVFLKQFEDYIKLYRLAQEIENATSAADSKIIGDLVKSINKDLVQEQKVWLILQLMEFIGDSRLNSPIRMHFVENVATLFNISKTEFDNGKNFILSETSEQIPQNMQVLLIDSLLKTSIKNIRHLQNERLIGKIFILRINSTNTFLVKYFGERQLFINSRNFKPYRTYIFGVGSVIRGERLSPIYYSRIAALLIQDPNKPRVSFMADSIEYRHRGSTNGLYKCSLHAHAGQLIGIMGGSGVGKSTLMNILNGNIKPASGTVYINGYNVHEDKKALKGVIGYVPQDDLLVEELTVYQNLYFNASLCFSNTSEKELVALVDLTLKDFDLVEARDLKVGDPLNKFISGGQRKRLNMAMELMREPSVLFIDEPTSGLSSMDSERVMLLLKKQTFKGKIIFANIHQPSSDIFKLFDAIIILDHGGHPIYQGNPMDAIVYFKKMGKYLNANESECITCGNVNTDLILKVVEARVVNEYGKLTRKRKRSANEWYELYQKNIESKRVFNFPLSTTPLPPNNFKIPSGMRQMWIFLRRNLLSKLANTQFINVSIFSAPVLALIVGYFSKYIHGTLSDPNAYIFSENDNLPSYLFMSIIAMIFLGLTISAEDIVKDRKIRYRESFLDLSYFSYINSKVIVLFFFSAIQSLLFLTIGNWILEIRGMFWSYWLILFSTAFCSNLLGLNLSAALKSVVAIYVMIPLILVPQLLFSGVIVNFNKLHKRIANPEYVPFVGDLMPSRWGYEALCVQQFCYNRYNRNLFEYNARISNSTYYSSLLLPKLESLLSPIRTEIAKDVLIQKHTPLMARDLNIVRNEIIKINGTYSFNGICSPDLSTLHIESITTENLEQTLEWINTLKSKFIAIQKQATRDRDAYFHELENTPGSNSTVFDLSRTYSNKSIENLVTNRFDIQQIEELNDRIVRRYEPIYAIPTSKIGRTPLFASYKRIGDWLIPTLWFNTAALWFISAILYTMLCSNIFVIIQRLMERLRFRKLTKRIAKYLPK